MDKEELLSLFRRGITEITAAKLWREINNISSMNEAKEEVKEIMKEL